ncbi:uncharacterized protein LOC135217759 [Macrobrachium nipponense]|uniref:uncharacterized protein LOC135217759 n=1 Tax=Macrobrachium nipponense TaxID=159736 RepID=UPI0030C83656
MSNMENMKKIIMRLGILWMVAFVTTEGDQPAPADECKPVTIWVKTTEFRNMAQEKNRQSMTYYEVPQTVTQIIHSTKMIPYFVTQTQNVPEFRTRVATLPQYITHTVFSTFIRSITKTEKRYNTVTATKTQQFYEMVCPEDY